MGAAKDCKSQFFLENFMTLLENGPLKMVKCLAKDWIKNAKGSDYDSSVVMILCDNEL